MTSIGPTVRVADAEGTLGLDHARRLFLSYAAEDSASIAESLCFQGFEVELAGLSGRYAPPAGCLLLAMARNVPAGCVALRDLGGGNCEMKRLYVAPEHRGRGVGHLLVEEVIRRAERLGYRRMVLDTLPEMAGALALYREYGFAETDRYWDNPVERTIFLAKRLTSVSPTPASMPLDRPRDETGEDMNPINPPQLLGPGPIAAAQRDDGSLSTGDLITAYESARMISRSPPPFTAMATAPSGNPDH